MVLVPSNRSMRASTQEREQPSQTAAKPTSSAASSQWWTADDAFAVGRITVDHRLGVGPMGVGLPASRASKKLPMLRAQSARMLPEVFDDQRLNS